MRFAVLQNGDVNEPELKRSGNFFEFLDNSSEKIASKTSSRYGRA